MNLCGTPKSWTNELGFRNRKISEVITDKIRRCSSSCMFVSMCASRKSSSYFTAFLYRSKSSRYKYFDFVVLTNPTEQRRKKQDIKAFSYSLLGDEMPELNACSTVCIECAFHKIGVFASRHCVCVCAEKLWENSACLHDDDY